MLESCAGFATYVWINDFFFVPRIPSVERVKFGEWWIPYTPENVKTSRIVMVVSCTARVDGPQPLKNGWLGK